MFMAVVQSMAGGSLQQLNLARSARRLFRRAADTGIESGVCSAGYIQQPAGTDLELSAFCPIVISVADKERAAGPHSIV